VGPKCESDFYAMIGGKLDLYRSVGFLLSSSSRDLRGEKGRSISSEGRFETKNGRGRITSCILAEGRRFSRRGEKKGMVDWEDNGSLSKRKP